MSKNIFMKAKPCAMFILLKDEQQGWYPSKLARASGSSYVHTINLLSKLRALGAITMEKKGKQNTVKLTEKGAYLALTIDDLVKKYASLEAEMKQKNEKAAQAAASPPEPPQKHEEKPPAEKK